MLNQTAVPEIIDGVRVIYRLSEDELLREKAFRTEKRIRDERTALDHATAEGEAKGRKEGIEIGEAKAKATMIEEMRKHGIDEALINQMLESLNENRPSRTS